MFDDLIPQAAAGQPAPLNIPVPVGPPSTDPTENPNGDGLTQDQIDAAVRARFAKAGAQGQANLAAAPGYVNNVVRATANAVPIVGGLADKLDAATSAALGGSYQGSLAQQQTQDQQFAQQNPVAATTAGLVGGGAGTVAMLPAAGLGVGGGSLLARTLTAGAAQGALGGADAAVRGQDVTAGAGLGAGGGIAGPLGGAAIGSGIRYAKGLMAPLPAELQGTGALERKWLAAALKGQTPADLQASADALGAPGMLGERSPGLLDLTQSVANNTGAGKAVVRDAFDTRNAGTNQRVMGAVDEALGPAQNPTPVRQAVEDTRAAVTTPYFQQAFQNGAPYTPDLASIAERPAVASALQDAATAAANRGTPFPNVTLDAAGNPVASDAALQAYEAGQRPAVTGALANMLGADPAMGPLATQDALTIRRSAAADPLYTAYRSMNVPMTPELAEVLQRPSVARAIPDAERKAQDQGRTIFSQGAPTPTDPSVPRPQSLQDFVQSLGGLQDPNGALASAGLGHLVAQPGQGLGGDAVRQAAARMGYFGADTAAAARGTTVDDLRTALSSGRPVHSALDQAAVEAWAARDAVANQPPQLTPEGLDYLKRTLGDRTDTAVRSGNRDDARIFTGLQGDLLGAIENHPDPSIADAYGAARRAYAGPSREMDALNAGRAAFGDNVTAEHVQREYASLATDGERQQYRNGLFSAGRDKVNKAGDTRAFIDMVAGNQTIRDKLATVAPHADALTTFHAAVDRARQQFTEAQRPTAEGLHGALQVLDARAARGEPGIAEARDALAAHLGRDPHYAYGRAQDQQYGSILDALVQGRTALRTGPNALHPEDFAERFGNRIPAGQAAERVTMRDAVDSGLRQTGNDYSLVKRLLQGDDGYNTAKLGTAFGQDAVDRLSGAIGREDLYKANQRAVMGGSPTGERLAVRDLTQPDPNNGVSGWWNQLYIDKPSTYLPPFLQPEALGERFLGSRYEAARERVAPQLVKTGSDADRLVRAVIESQKRRGSIPAPDTDRLVRALAATLAGGRQAISQ
jgi:hypothetical protein